MSNRLAGYLEVKEKCPYVYFIIKSTYIYIGQTQSNPIIRWNSHLQIQGEFKKHLMEKDIELALSDNEINFYVFSCEEILEYSTQITVRRNTEYIEGLLTTKFFESNLAGNYTVISSCDNAPIDSDKSEFLDKIVEEIMLKFTDLILENTKKLGNDQNIFCF